VYTGLQREETAGTKEMTNKKISVTCNTCRRSPTNDIDDWHGVGIHKNMAKVVEDENDVEINFLCPQCFEGFKKWWNATAVTKME
jgi:hypothetical protein